MRDLIGPNLRVLFCGINPSLYSAATGHHFARPGNRFWPTLFAAGFTTRRLVAHEGAELLSSGYGVTNLVRRATAAASELSDDEYVHGGQRLARKVRQYRPRFLAILGVGAYRAAWGRPGAQLGPQAERLGGTAIWVLPNPSGLNAHYQIDDLAKLYRQLRQACEVA
ncbi:MAG: G/U mismatch-specific DNA glycosylase [Gemmataceae bacterium]